MPNVQERANLIASIARIIAAKAATQPEMRKASEGDKEFYFQNWLTSAWENAGVSFQANGRNAYPDYWVGPSNNIGIEAKALGYRRNRPARNTLDFNSHLPVGSDNAKSHFLAFLLYETTADKLIHKAHTICLAHLDLINLYGASLAAGQNKKVSPFGSYGDGFIRNRMMYVLPHPVQIADSILAKTTLILPASWPQPSDTPRSCLTISRSVSEKSAIKYTVNIESGTIRAQDRRQENSGETHHFSVYDVTQRGAT